MIILGGTYWQKCAITNSKNLLLVFWLLKKTKPGEFLFRLP